jgi:uncharacterized MAPEG superfamily protein
MTTELTLLAWTLVLAVAQILLPASLRSWETGLRYNTGPRDRPSLAPIGILTGRMMRAQANLFETLPLFIGAVLIAHVAQVHTTMTYWGAMFYFWARVVYVPLYAFGIPYIRSLAWLVSLIGVLMLLAGLL